MLMYDYQIQNEIALLGELARRILERFDSAPAADLLRDVALLRAVYTRLIESLPTGLDDTSFARHMGFMIRNLEKGEKDRSDIADIVRVDLPAMSKRFADWTVKSVYVDEEFSRKVGGLLGGNHLNAAVREAFVVLKERMVRVFGVSPPLDGKDLVNKVFGAKQGILAGKLDESELLAYRNLFDGLFSVFRNKYAHNDVIPERYEVDAILASVNWALKEIDRLR